MPGPPVTLRVSLKTNAAFRLVALALGCALPGHVDVSAQQGQTASIEGRVTDVSGAVLGGARVTAASPQMIGGVPMTETAPDGRYRLSSLLPGTYEIAVTHQGFKTLLYSDIELSPGIGLTLDVRLEVAPVSETVHVRSAAPVIDVRSSSVPTVIDRNFIDNLPLDSTNQVGGAVVRDRLWFFTGLEYFSYSRRPTAFASLPRTPNEPAVSTEEPKLLAKVTTAHTHTSRLEGYVSHGSSTVTNSNAGPLVQPEALARVTVPQWMANARLTWPLSDRTLVEGRYGAFWQHRTAGPTPPSSASGPSGHVDRFTGVLSVNAPQFSDSEEQTGSVAFTVTRYVDRLGGTSHAFKVGVEHEWASAVYRTGWPGDAQYYDYNGARDLLYQWTGSTLRPSHRRTSVYVQEAWRVGDRVTVEPGVRVGFYDSSLPVDGVDSYRNSSVSPRLGVAWDVAPDHRTVIRAHYGRYHDPMVTSFYDFLDPLGHAPTIVMQANSSGQFQEVTRYVVGYGAPW